MKIFWKITAVKDKVLLTMTFKFKKKLKFLFLCFLKMFSSSKYKICHSLCKNKLWVYKSKAWNLKTFSAQRVGLFVCFSFWHIPKHMVQEHVFQNNFMSPCKRLLVSLLALYVMFEFTFQLQCSEWYKKQVTAKIYHRNISEHNYQ